MNKWIETALSTLRSYGEHSPQAQTSPTVGNKESFEQAYTSGSNPPGEEDGKLDKQEKRYLKRLFKEEFKEAGQKRPKIVYLEKEKHEHLKDKIRLFGVNNDHGIKRINRPIAIINSEETDKLIHNVSEDAVRFGAAHEAGHEPAEEIAREKSRNNELRSNAPSRVTRFKHELEYIADELAAKQTSIQAGIELLQYVEGNIETHNEHSSSHPLLKDRIQALELLDTKDHTPSPPPIPDPPDRGPRHR